MTEVRKTPGTMGREKVQTALHVLKTVFDPLSLEQERELATVRIQQAGGMDVEEDFILRIELNERRSLLRKVFVTQLTPPEIEAVQQRFGLNLFTVPETALQPALSPLFEQALVFSALSKLRKNYEIQALLPQRQIEPKVHEKTEAKTRDNQPALSLKATEPVQAEPRIIPQSTIDRVLSLKQQRQERHGGLNNSQICKAVGITKAELEEILRSQTPQSF